MTTYIKYIDYNSNSNIESYFYGSDFIIIEFKDNPKKYNEDRYYKYTYFSAGHSHINEMIRLAKQNDGLNSYISKHKPKYQIKSPNSIN